MAISARTLALLVAGACLFTAGGFAAWRALPRPDVTFAWEKGGDPLRDVKARLAHDEPAPPDPSKVRAAVAVHTFGDTPAATDPVAARLRQDGMRVSQVLLGGHGGLRHDFALSTWFEWERPIQGEYAARRALGYRDVGIVAYSAGATLVAEMLNRRALEPPPGRIVLVSPFLDFADPGVPIAAVFGLFGRYNRPMWQLLDLTMFTSRRLEKGIPLTPDQRVLIVHLPGDTVGAPGNAEKFRKGMKGGTVEVESIEGDLADPGFGDRLNARISAFLRDAPR